MHVSPGRQALQLAAEGRSTEALACLQQHAAQGDAEALFVRGLWQIEGKLLARHLKQARDDLKASADRGNRDAARILAGLLASGAGGVPDWASAVEVLRHWADTDPVAERQRTLIKAMDLGTAGNPRRLPESVRLSDAPETVRFPGLLSAGECDFLRDVAGQRFRPALIFHEAKRQFVKDPIRDSDTASFPLVFEWPVVHALNRRIAAATGTDVAQGEPLQILRYAPGQQYKPHLDAIAGLANQRVLTVIVWLNDDYAGGETHFLESGLSVRGAKGDALMFRNALPDGRPDPASRHAGLPVTDGEKLIASRWIRQRPPSGPDDAFGPHEAEQASRPG
ncbi:MAG TPA: 2OG-Fe(II) oxygenase [Allosphingosinicella sp.]|nr:2OG-Fe(II) oxygenase [Allosphingosinicella sp.]